MIINAILKINPNAVVTVRGDDINTCEIEWQDGTTPISKADIEAQIPVVEQEIADAETATETNKTSGKAILKTGEALTDAEVEALFG